MTYRVVLPYAVCAVDVDPDVWIVTDACPLMRWAVGKRWTNVGYWVKRKGGTWTVIRP